MAEHTTSHNHLRWLATGLKLFLLVTMVLCVSYKTTAAQAPVVNIGDISELTGTAEVIRDQPYGAALDFDIQQMDDVRTTAGRVAITFLDASLS